MTGSDRERSARIPPSSPGTPPPSRPTRVVVHPDGPYLVTGEIELRTPDGTVVRRLDRAALCRCGRSATKPFCDGSHGTTGFADPGLRQPRESAERDPGTAPA